jgi:deoxyribodipyrimidine photolyase-related protein
MINLSNNYFKDSVMNCTLILIDQLSECLPAYKAALKNNDRILLIESYHALKSPKHHQKKIVFLLSAQRHFFARAQQQTDQIDYLKLQDTKDDANLFDTLKTYIHKNKIKRLSLTHPSELDTLQQIESLRDVCQVQIFDDTRFLASPTTFANWAEGKKDVRACILLIVAPLKVHRRAS